MELQAVVYVAYMVGECVSVEFENGKEGFLWHFDASDLFHALFAGFLLLQEFAFTAHVAAVAFCSHVFADGLYSLSGNDFSADSGLDGDVELLSRNEFFQFLAHAATKGDGVVYVGEGRECVDALTVEQYIEFHEFALAVVVDVVVERCVAFRYAFEFVVEVDNDFAQRQVEGEFDAVSRNIILLNELASFAETESHYRTYEIGRCDYRGTDIWLFNALY